MNGQSGSVGDHLKCVTTVSHPEIANTQDQPKPAPPPDNPVMPKTREELMSAKAEAVEKLLRPNSNVVGVGIGKKITEGKESQEEYVRVYVVEKKDPDTLGTKHLVQPKFGNQIKTTVIQVGRFGRRGHPARPPMRPAGTILQLSSSIRVKTDAPNVNEGAKGSLGAVVTDGPNQYILSCNHVLDRNGRVPNDAKVVWARFVGTQPVIAGRGPSVSLDPYTANETDCALALLTKTVQTTFPDGSKLSSDQPVNPTRGMKVVKFGPVTGRTEGIIVDRDVDLYVDYSFGTFHFTEQVLIYGGEDETNPFAAAGDSGAIVIDESTKRATAMVVAASGKFTVACPLDKVLAAFAEKAGVTNLHLVI